LAVLCPFSNDKRRFSPQKSFFCSFLTVFNEKLRKKANTLFLRIKIFSRRLTRTRTLTLIYARICAGVCRNADRNNSELKH
jgi:hypothetical protein